jgi:hypothetical protein
VSSCYAESYNHCPALCFQQVDRSMIWGAISCVATASNNRYRSNHWGVD